MHSIVFINAGRYITGFVYYLSDFFNINEDIFSIISIILSNIILSLGIVLIYSKIASILNMNGLKRLIVFCASFLMCYNPFMAETFVFEESFIMAGAFLVSLYAANIMFENKKNCFIKSFLLLILACTMYQGMLCIYFPYYLLLVVLKYNKLTLKEFIKENYKNILKSLICYILAMIVYFIIFKLIIFIFDLNSAKDGKIDLLYNIKNIFKLIFDTADSMHDFINPYLFHGINILLLVIIVINIILKKENISKIIYILIIILSSILFSYAPNVVMSSVSNYTAARLVNSYGCITAFLILSNLTINIESKIKNILIFIISLFMILVISYNLFKYSYYGIIRYSNDLNYLNEIKEKIVDYEKKSNMMIENVIYYRSKNSYYYYPGLGNGYNVRFYSQFWSFTCAFENYVIKNLKHSEMSEEEFNKNYLKNNFDEEIEYIFEENKLYIFFL